MSISYDLVIAGGGLGGATLAKNMAEHGAKVLVIERERARFVESCRKTGAKDAQFKDSRQIGPLATFSCAQSWVDHPYRDGVVLMGDTATSSDPVQGLGLSLTLRDARVLRDCLLSTDDWDAAADAYATEHDAYAGRLHKFNQWYSELFLAMGPDADARRARAMPLIAQDPSRQPDSLFSGPDMPAG